LAAVVVALILGALGSGIWETLFRPTLGSLSRVALSIVALGSETVRNSVYREAALNPTALPSLGWMLVLSVAITGTSLGFAFARVLPRLSPLKQLEREAELLEEELGQLEGKTEALVRAQPSSPEIAAQQSRLEEAKKKAEGFLQRSRRMLRILDVLLAAMLAFFGGILLFWTLIINQSVLVWRAFNADMAICAPSQTPDERTRLAARFAAMSSRADYQVLHEELLKVAATHQMKLTKVDVW
jgi:hypothetical protein